MILALAIAVVTIDKIFVPSNVARHLLIDLLFITVQN